MCALLLSLFVFADRVGVVTFVAAFESGIELAFSYTDPRCTGVAGPDEEASINQIR